MANVFAKAKFWFDVRAWTVALGLLALPALSATVTITWIGSESGGNWSDSNNWDKTPITWPKSGSQPSDIPVWDFSKLTDGATVVNDYDQSTEYLYVGGFVFGGNAGRITLSGGATSETVFAKGNGHVVSIVAPAGTTANIALRHTTGPWKDQSATVLLSGAGTFRFGGASFEPTMWTFKHDTEDAKLVLGEGAKFHNGYLNMASKKLTVELECDMEIQAINLPKWTSNVESLLHANGHKVAFTTGTSGSGTSGEPYMGVVDASALRITGGGTFMTRASFLAGSLILENADLDYGRTYWIPGNPRVSTNGPLQLQENSSLAIDGAGKLKVYCSQELSTLSGEGTSGGILLATNWDAKAVNVQLNGASAPTTTVYHGSINGVGGLFKNGADYELVLTGKHGYTGATEVVEGTLTLRHEADPAVADQTLYCDFETLKPTFDSTGSVAPELVGTASLQTGGGVRGGNYIVADPTGDGKGYVDVKSGLKGLAGGNAPFTIGYWVKLDKRYTTANKLVYLGIFGNGGWINRQMLRINVTTHTTLNFTVGPYNEKSVAGTGDGVAATFDEAELYDGNWHYLTATYGEGNVLKAYWDGRLLGSQIIDGGINLPKTGIARLGSEYTANPFWGCADELKIYNRELTAEEILVEYRGLTVPPTGLDALPEPLAHWAFDDAENIGKDSTPNGHDLSVTAGKPGVWVQDGGIGKVLYAGVALHLESYPESFPTGRMPFTLSCRYRPSGCSSPSPILTLGDTSTHYNFIMATTDSAIRRQPALNWWAENAASPTLSLDGVGVTIGSTSASWIHVVYTYDGKYFRCYADGRLVATQMLNDLNIQPGEVKVGCVNASTPGFNGCIDDLQVFGVALSQAQIRTLLRNLPGESDGRILPAASPLSVAAGATLKIEGPAHTVGSLSGAGTLNLAKGGEFTLPAASAFSGALTGAGILHLQDGILPFSDLSAFAGVIDPGTALKLTLASASPDVPGLQCAGSVVLPASLEVRFTDQPAAGTYTVVDAGSLNLPDDFTGWTVCGPGGQVLAADDWRCTFAAVGGKIILTLKERKGLMLIIR